MNIPGWEHFYHGADIGVRGVARSKERAFEQAALAMTAVVADPTLVRDATEVDVTVSAPDDELLLVEWLNTLVYEMSARGMLFGRFEVSLEGQLLRGRAWGEEVDRERHQPAVEVKGATLTDVTVLCNPDGVWRAQCVVDV